MTTAIDIAALDPASRDAGAVAHYGDPVREQRLLADRGRPGRPVAPHRASRCPATTGSPGCTASPPSTSTELRPWQGTELLVLSPHGHVEHHAMVTDDGTTTWLDLEPGTGDAAGVPGADAVHDAGRAGRRHRRLGGAVAGRPGHRRGARARSASSRSATPDVARRAGREVRPGHPPPRPSTIRYRVAGASATGWVAAGRPDGADLLVPRAADEDVALDIPLAGLWAYEAAARRGPAAAARASRPTTARCRPRPGSPPPPCTWRRAATGARRRSPGCTTSGRPPRKLVLLHLDGITTDELPAPGTPVHARTAARSGSSAPRCATTSWARSRWRWSSSNVPGRRAAAGRRVRPRDRSTRLR